MPEETKGKKEGEKDVEMKDAGREKGQRWQGCQERKGGATTKDPQDLLYPQSFHENCLCFV